MKKYLSILLAAAMILSLVPAALAAGEVSGTVTVYTPDSDMCQEALLTVASEKYPDLEVEIVSGGMSELVARLTAEAASPVCDVAWGAFAQGDGDAYWPLIETYTTSVIDNVNVVDPNGYYNYYISEIPVMIVNTALEAELGFEITGYADLLRPELKGKIISADPTNSSSAWKQLIAMLSVYGGFNKDEAWDYVKALMGQLNGSLSGSSSNCYKAVISGEYVVGLSYESGVVTQLINGAQDVKMVYPADGTIQSCFAVSKVKGCPNPAAAEAIIDIICSEDYQNIVAETAGARGCNKLASPAQGAAPIDTINLIEINLDDYAENQKMIQEKWNDLWAEVN